MEQYNNINNSDLESDCDCGDKCMCGQRQYNEYVRTPVLIMNTQDTEKQIQLHHFVREAKILEIPIQIIQRYTFHLQNSGYHWSCRKAYDEWFKKYYTRYNNFVAALKNELLENIDYKSNQNSDDKKREKTSYLISFDGLKQLEMRCDKQTRLYYIQLENLTHALFAKKQQAKQHVINWANETNTPQLQVTNQLTIGITNQDQQAGVCLGQVFICDNLVPLPIFLNNSNYSLQQQQEYDQDYEALNKQIYKSYKSKNQNKKSKNKKQQLKKQQSSDSEEDQETIDCLLNQFKNGF